MLSRTLLAACIFVGASQESRAGASRLAAGDDHLLFLREDSTLWAMGADTYGQLGLKGTSPQPLPVQVGASRWRKVSAGASYSLALRHDGSLWAFGRNQAAQSGKGYRRDLETPKRVGKNLWLDVAAGHTVTMGIRQDSSLRIWGGWEKPSRKGWFRGSLGQSRQPAKGKWKTVAVGVNHGLALKNDGTLWALGENALGQAGCEADSLGFKLCQVGDGKWNAIAAAGNLSVGIREDGSLWTWGEDSLGGLGRAIPDGKTGALAGMGQVGADQWLAVAAGSHHMLALRSDSTLWAWGLGRDGALGIGGLEKQDFPVRVNAAKWQAIAAGGRFSAAIRADGQPMVWGNLGFAAGEGGGSTLIDRPVALEQWREYKAAPTLAGLEVAKDNAQEAMPVDEPPPRPVAAVTAREAEPIAKPLPAVPVSNSPSWTRAHKGWIMAGGGAVAAGAVLWIYLASDGEGATASPDLGVPPEEPVVQGAK